MTVVMVLKQKLLSFKIRNKKIINGFHFRFHSATKNRKSKSKRHERVSNNIRQVFRGLAVTDQISP